MSLPFESWGAGKTMRVEFCGFSEERHNIAADDFIRKDAAVFGNPESGAGAPEAITGDTSPHAGLVFARECAQVSNPCSHMRTSGGLRGSR